MPKLLTGQDVEELMKIERLTDLDVRLVAGRLGTSPLRVVSSAALYLDAMSCDSALLWRCLKCYDNSSGNGQHRGRARMEKPSAIMVASWARPVSEFLSYNFPYDEVVGWLHLSRREFTVASAALIALAQARETEWGTSPRRFPDYPSPPPR